MDALPSALKEILGSGALRGNLRLRQMTIPFNIVNVVCRTHPGMACSIFSLYFGDKGTYMLGNKESTGTSGSTNIRLVREILVGRNIGPGMYALLPTARRTANRVLGTINCVSLYVPHNKGGLVGFIHSATGMPIVRAKTNIMRYCFSGSNSLRVNGHVVAGTGYQEIDMYGTLSYLLVRRDELDSLPTLYRNLTRGRAGVRTSTGTCRTLGKRCPSALLCGTRRDRTGVGRTNLLATSYGSTSSARTSTGVGDV